MLIAAGLKTVFKKPSAVFGALGIFFVLLFVVVWLPNLRFLWTILTSPFFSAGARVKIIVSGFGGLATNFTPLSLIITITVLTLTSVYLAMVVVYLEKRSFLYREAGFGASAFVLGMFGVGCASCGSVIISGLLGAGAAAGFLGFFPLNGQEFGIASIALLLVSLGWLSRKFADPVSCASAAK